MDLKRYEKLRDDLAKIKREVDRAEGALLQLKKRLKEEFDCDSVEDAEDLLEELTEELEDKEREFEQELDRFEDLRNKCIKEMSG